MKSLCDGFYIYTNYNIIDGVKHQTIRAIFEYSNHCCPVKVPDDYYKV